MTLRDRLENQVKSYSVKHLAFKEVATKSSIQEARDSATNLMHEYGKRIRDLQSILDADAKEPSPPVLEITVTKTFQDWFRKDPLEALNAVVHQLNPTLRFVDEK